MYSLRYEDQEKFVKEDGKVTVGRARSNDIVCEDTMASRFHGEFSLEQGQLSYRDLESTNGSRIDGKVLAPYKWEILGKGQALEIGEWSAVVHKEEGAVPQGGNTGAIASPSVDPAGPQAAYELTKARMVPEGLTQNADAQ